ncbi:M23 family metallopeptidase [Calidifontibacter sp. DB0510]|uniref:M23 family metallopeptidase n=1 Tax=Metallococcus carri TaxID=1656884 RepID=A0A967ED34_9MICO|nr:M23 family metallopeptidase [Metallococcus carri]NHN54331.1 M23 family metallopeptidase [Metallococcus carri]NOP36829.1 M23 family metallopeptidase [Calidifontibacter sp. DB2511S]
MSIALLAAWLGLLVGLGPVATPAPAHGYVWPLDPQPQVVRRFEQPPARWAAGHRGVDLLGSPGQQVRSAGGGVVVWSGMLAGRGVVSVRHPNGWRTTYEPVDRRAPPGTVVTPGAAIGSLATTGGHCLPRACLHWGLLVGKDSYRDPLTLLGDQRVVLLPLG